MRNTLKYIAIAAVMAACGIPSDANAAKSYYKISMTLKVPRVFNNSDSMGYRKVQSQKIVGYISVDRDSCDEFGEPKMEAIGLVNTSHRISGKRVTYDSAIADEVMWRYVGNNKTDVFKNATIKFGLDLNPSYNIGDDEPDNTLIMTLSGYGFTDRNIRGSVTGQIGCGCTAYGHVSPTRTIEGRIDDIAPVCGVFTMRMIDADEVVIKK